MSVPETRALQSMMMLVDRKCKRRSGTGAGSDAAVAAPNGVAGNTSPKNLAKLDDAVQRANQLTARARPMMEHVRERLHEVRSNLDRLQWVSRLRPVSSTPPQLQATPAIVVAPAPSSQSQPDTIATASQQQQQAAGADISQLQQQVRDLQRQLQDVQADARRAQATQLTHTQATMAQFGKLGSSITNTCAMMQELQPRVAQVTKDAAHVAKRLPLLESAIVTKEELNVCQKKWQELYDQQLRQHKELLLQAQREHTVKLEEALLESVRASSMANSLEAVYRSMMKQVNSLEEVVYRGMTKQVNSLEETAAAHSRGLASMTLQVTHLKEDTQRLEGNLTEQQLAQAELAAKLTSMSSIVTDLQVREMMTVRMEPIQHVEAQLPTDSMITTRPDIEAATAAAAPVDVPLSLQPASERGFIDAEAKWQARYDEKQSTIERAINLKVAWMAMDTLPDALLTLSNGQPRTFLIEIVATKGALVVRSKRRVNAHGNITESLIQGDDSLIQANHASRLDDSLVMPSSSSSGATATAQQNAHAAATAAGYSENDLHALASLAEQSSVQHIVLRTYCDGAEDRRVAFASDDPAALIENDRISLPVSGIELRAAINGGGKLELFLRRNIRRLPVTAIKEGSWAWVVSVQRQSSE
jgi:hypothetical protein